MPRHTQEGNPQKRQATHLLQPFAVVQVQGTVWQPLTVARVVASPMCCLLDRVITRCCCPCCACPSCCTGPRLRLSLWRPSAHRAPVQKERGRRFTKSFWGPGRMTGLQGLRCDRFISGLSNHALPSQGCDPWRLKRAGKIICLWHGAALYAPSVSSLNSQTCTWLPFGF